MGKRELPTRHNFLTEAIQELLESKVTDNERLIDQRAILTITSNTDLIKEYPYDNTPILPSHLSNDSTPTSSSPTTPNRSAAVTAAERKAVEIKQIPDVRIIEPITRRSLKQHKAKARKALTKKTPKDGKDTEATPSNGTAVKVDDMDGVDDEEEEISDEFYLKRHRRHEMEEKKQKNREKEMLRHGYYQQKQLVERIKSMDKIVLQSIVSSIRHRTSSQQQSNKEQGKGKTNTVAGKKKQEQQQQLSEENVSNTNKKADEEDYLDNLHQRLLYDALEHLRRYELLGFSSGVSNNINTASSYQQSNHHQSSSAYHIANDFREEVEEQEERNEQEQNQEDEKEKPDNNDTTVTEKSKTSPDDAVTVSDDSRKKRINISKDFKEALEMEERVQGSRRIGTFGGNPILTGGGRGMTGSRRSTRHVLAFGHKVPDFEIEEFELPRYIVEDWKASALEQKRKKTRKSSNPSDTEGEKQSLP
ncbi:hypothetical protein BDF20DRAFT_843762 [Mycotypha africana]|uniref:uncharacterized protein n=1 Tax=Mycotypha africana TaxID=64632 RepID=UPI002300396C|nr:uncharacterized protein BDF20DRAFT_843762 [Mycotypha africana]KAI8991273.1 hypothetical protein BDF20DRAFT_843762 [Mycotypha africana]